MGQHWHTWVYNYFYKGKTIGVYLLIILFLISAYELILNRIYLQTFIPLLIMAIFSYGLFTDLVAHLWYDAYDTGISYKKFISLVFKGRTHDIYGLIVYTSLAIYELSFINKIGGILLICISLTVIFLITKTKFYH